MELKILNKSQNPLPEYAKKGDAGMDLRSNESTIVAAHTRAIIKTGIHIELPEGYEAQIRPRSGLSKQKLDIAFGTIDSNYRGEIGICFINNSDKDFTISKGDRIAQMVINKLPFMELVEVYSLSESERGVNGFGHTGIS